MVLRQLDPLRHGVDRNGARILVGEYGATEGNPTGNLRSALGEAAFLTGIERNSDAVIGSMFAPVFVNENAVNWGTNLIGLDAAGSYGSPSYWVEKLFAENTGKQVVASSATGTGGLKQVVSKTTEGGRTTFYVKVVNFSNQQQSARLNFSGVSRFDEGVQQVLTGDPNVRNTLAAPTAIAPGAPKALSNLGAQPAVHVPGLVGDRDQARRRARGPGQPADLGHPRPDHRRRHRPGDAQPDARRHAGVPGVHPGRDQGLRGVDDGHGHRAPPVTRRSR